MPILDSEFQWLAYKSHILGGAVAIWGPAALFGPKSIWYGAGLITLFAAVKEGLWDPKYETKEVAGSGWRDFYFYVVGEAIAISFYLIAHHP